MQSIPVKIQKETDNRPVQVRQQDQTNNNSPSSPDGTPKMPAAKPRHKFPWLALVLFAVIIAQTIGLFLFWQARITSPYARFVPQNAMAVYFNQSNLTGLAATLKGQSAWPPFAWSQNAFTWLFTKISPVSAADLSGLFADQMLLAIIPSDNDAPPWLLITTKKTSAANFADVLTQAEKTLKQSFNLIKEPYRQNTITEIKPLSQNPNRVYYALIKDYLLISNNAELLKQITDKIIK